MVRPFRFGAAVFDEGTGAEWRDRARRVEDLGYSTLLLPDHFVTNFSPFPALAVAAAATRSLRVGTMVVDNDFRHPAVVAKDAATLDVVTDGRLELGIGAGWHEPEYIAAGIPFDPPATRVERLEEAVAVLKGLWAAKPLTFEGAHYRITDMEGLPKPAQTPHPPLMIGGGGRRLLRLAASEADIVSFAAHVRPGGGVDAKSLTAAGVTERIQWLRADAAGRFDEIELSNYYSTPAIVTRDRDGAADEILAHLKTRFGDVRLTREDIFASPHYLIGEPAQMIDALVERRERFGVSYIVFTDQVEDYADVVAALAGS